MRLGDLDGDGEVSAKDAMFAMRIAMGKTTPTEQQQEVADVNEDGEVNLDDVMDILHDVVNRGAPGVDFAAGGGRQISIMMSDAHGVAGESLTVPLKVDNPGLLAAGDVIIKYDSSVLRATEVSSDAGALLVSNVDEPGTARIMFARTNILSSAVLAEVKFDVLTDDASPLTLERADLYRHDSLLLDVEMTHGRFKSWDMPPDRSALLQNFPNPFNPETWLPYQLKEGSHIVIQIFSLKGELIRKFDLGYKPAGLYISRGNAVYWDGRNESGEQVASGLYIYSIEAGDLRATRKMVIAR
jgi:hypothetical protein